MHRTPGFCRERSRGFSLVELLVVVGILIILAGLSFSVFQVAKERSQGAVEISHLRQIGAAGVLYSMDHDGAFPLSVWPLLAERRIPEELAWSVRDPHERGSLRIIHEFNANLLPDAMLEQEFRASYIGPKDLNWQWPYFREQTEGREAVGWLLSLVRAKYLSSAMPSEGHYMRLTLEGSVVHRVIWPRSFFLPDSGQMERGISFIDYLGDDPAQRTP